MTRIPDWLNNRYIRCVEIQCDSLIEYLYKRHPKRTLNRIKTLKQWLYTIERGIKEENMHKGPNYVFEDEPGETTDWTERELHTLSCIIPPDQHRWHFYKQRVGHMTSYIATIVAPNGAFQAFDVERLAAKIASFYSQLAAFNDKFAQGT